MIINRIKQIIDYKQVSERFFCKEIGVANGFMNKVKDVGAGKLNKILYTYPEINPVWLLTGEGEMLKKGNCEIANSKQFDQRDLGRYEAKTEMYEGEINNLKKLLEIKNKAL